VRASFFWSSSKSLKSAPLIRLVVPAAQVDDFFVDADGFKTIARHGSWPQWHMPSWTGF